MRKSSIIFSALFSTAVLAGCSQSKEPIAFQPVAQNPNIFSQQRGEITYDHADARDLQYGTEGLTRHHAAAFADHLRAAQSGYAAAMNEVGVMYASGHGVYQNLGAAEDWFFRAADLGHAPARTNLAIMHLSGLARVPSRSLAVHYLHESAAQGNARAIRILSTLRDSPEEARRDLMRAADLGDKDAMRALGYPVDSGIDMETFASDRMVDAYGRTPSDVFHGARQYDELDWLREDSRAQIEAKANLASRYLQGDGVPKDPWHAARLAYDAARAGSPVAMLQMAHQSEHGLGMPRNLVHAYAWYVRAASVRGDHVDWTFSKMKEMEHRITTRDAGVAQDLAARNAIPSPTVR